MQKPNEAATAEGFIASVLKYSVSTFANVGILGVAVLLTGLWVDSGANSQISLFYSYTSVVMNIAVLGLDQALIRFYSEPPRGLSRGGLFRVCLYLSCGALAGGGVVCCALFARPLWAAIGFSAVGPQVIPLLFANALFYMAARYFNVLYRMEGNIAVYTAESIFMQFFYKMFFLAGAALPAKNPVWAMLLCGTAGLGAFALVFCLARRAALRPRRAELTRGAAAALLPYGLAIAPAAIIVILNGGVAQSLIVHLHAGAPAARNAAAGLYAYAYTLSNAVTMVQLGFASFWGPYMFANYKTQQARIQRVHDYLNLAVLCFFALLVAFEDLIFMLLPKYAGAQPVFALMMLSAVFTILCETTVYGNAIARRPVWDTIGFALALAVNVGLCALLVPRFGLLGAAAALAAGNFAMFLLRTLTAQRLYRSVAHPAKTAAAVAAAAALSVAGTAWAHMFWAKLAASAAAAALYCIMYRRQLARLARAGLSVLRRGRGQV